MATKDEKTVVVDERRDEEKTERDLAAADKAAQDTKSIEITAEVVDNAYVCLCIDGKTFDLRQDELHRLRKVTDRAAIDLPR